MTTKVYFGLLVDKPVPLIIGPLTKGEVGIFRVKFPALARAEAREMYSFSRAWGNTLGLNQIATHLRSSR